MKGFILTSPFTLEEKEIIEEKSIEPQSKVRVTKCLITLSDILRFRGELEADNLALGSSGIGIVSETDANMFDLEKGKHTYIEPTRECGECFNCKNGETSKCNNIQIACEDFNGFLTDFVSCPNDKLFALPESVSDLEALFIDHISRALSIVDKLNIQKGDYVSVVGANNFGNILAQLLIYYQAVPIVMSSNEDDYKTLKDSGIYYVLKEDDNWQKEVASITSGRMTNKVVYISDCNVPISKAFSLASFNAQVAFTGVGGKTSSVSFNQAIKKQLDIMCINNGFGNTATSINLIANKAINLSNLKLDTANVSNLLDTFKKLSDMYEQEGRIFETVVDLL